MMVIVGAALGIALLTVIYIAACWAPERKFEDLQARWGRAPSLFVKVGGMRVHLRDEGPREDASPIVLLHGTVSSLHTWEGWAEALKRDRRVIRVDLPGFGLTGPSPDRRYGGQNDVQFVIALLDHLNIDRCVLGGNSLGGGISWRTALLHPSRVEKLILVDANGYPARATSKPIAFYFAGMPLLPWMVRNTFPGAIVEQGLRNVYGDPTKMGSELIVRTRELTQLQGNRGALIERGRQLFQPSKLAHRIAELKLPTLIIWGGRDRLIPPDSAERFHRDITGSTMVIFDDLGHAAGGGSSWDRCSGQRASTVATNAERRHAGVQGPGLTRWIPSRWAALGRLEIADRLRPVARAHHPTRQSAALDASLLRCAGVLGRALPYDAISSTPV